MRIDEDKLPTVTLTEFLSKILDTISFIFLSGVFHDKYS